MNQVKLKFQELLKKIKPTKKEIMADDFFGFKVDFPTQVNVLGRHTAEEELLTDDVEDEYDALNDETFGHAANYDWEEAHEKLSELIKHNNLDHKSVFNDSLLETDDSQDEIISKSISQLGLEDDLDDPAIMTIARNCQSLRHSGSAFGSSSPPPPAILETLECGSPKTHSIWSTTPKDSGITSFLQSVGQKPGNYSPHNSSGSFDSSSDNVFTSPPKAWRAEDLERDLLSKEPTQQHFPGSWPPVPQINKSNHNSLSQSPPRLPNAGQHQNKVAMDRMLTREEVERQMHADNRMCFPPNVQNNYGPTHMMPPMLHQNIMSPIGSPRPTSLNAPNQSSPILPLRPMRSPMLGNNCAPDPYLFMTARMNNMMHNRMPLRGPLPNLPPGFNPSNMNLNHKILNLPPRTIAHPLLCKHFQFPVVYHNKYYGNEDMRNTYHEDEYAGLMTQREKEWLIRIQLLLLKTENPYVEDYYFATQVARRCQKKYSESANKGAGDAPELILPASSKHENKTYVPTQFEGSLGKLQAVSVNFPRKVLDITVTRPLEDDEGRVVTNQSLLKYRRLLIDIEKMYTNFLEIEDEERRILAKPDSESGPHRVNIDKMTKNIYNGLVNDIEDNFQNIMTIRKGRSLAMRVFKIFNKEQQLQSLNYLFQYLPFVLKKDQNDRVLVQHLNTIVDAIEKITNLSDLLQLGEALQNDTSLEQQSVKKDKSTFASALKYKFGSTVICKILLKAEELYCGLDMFASDIQSRWAKIVQNLVDCICSLPNSAIEPPEISCVKLLTHIQRFDVNSDKFEVLKEKLAVMGEFSQKSQNGITNETA